jgi:hypothetical protein
LKNILKEIKSGKLPVFDGQQSEASVPGWQQQMVFQGQWRWKGEGEVKKEDSLHKLWNG